MTAQKVILHISADYPDPLDGGKTRAVANLLALAPGYAHHVYSLNRIDWRQDLAALPFTDGNGVRGGASDDGSAAPARPDDLPHRAVAYPAPPKGLFHRRYLERLADWIIADATARGLVPDQVHAHKLSVEALTGARVAHHFGARLIVSSQGDSDLKIIGAKRDLRPVYRDIWQRADVVLPFAPWTATALSQLLGDRSGPLHILPVPARAEMPAIPPISAPADPVIASVFHLASYKRKNAATLMAATALARETCPELRLDIAGGGNAPTFAAMSRMMAGYNGAPRNQTTRNGAQAPIRLIGPLAPDAVRGFLNRATLFALPSWRETFGMVFVEALMAGCPVIFPEGAAIAGYLPGVSYARPVPAGDSAALAATMTEMIAGTAAIRADLARAQTDGSLAIFGNDAIAATYRAALDAGGGR